MTAGSPFPFMPNKDGSPPDLPGSVSTIYRISANLSGKTKGYEVKQLYALQAPLPKQDDRYNTMPYRYGYAACPDPTVAPGEVAGSCYARMDVQNGTYELWNAGPKVSLAEPVFAPKSVNSREGEGYLLGVAYNLDQNLRSDLVILDASDMSLPPIASVHIPHRIPPGFHGNWLADA